MTTNNIQLDNVKSKNGIPRGGSEGQILCKKSNNDYDAQWIDNVDANQAETLPGLPVVYYMVTDFDVKMNSSLQCPTIRWSVQHDEEYEALTSCFYHAGTNTLQDSPHVSGVIFSRGSNSSFGSAITSSSIYGDGTTKYSSVYFYIYNSNQANQNFKIPLYLSDGTKVTALSQLKDIQTARIELFGTYLGNTKGVITSFPL